MNFISKTEAEILLDMKRKDPEGKYEIVKLMEAFDFNRNYCMIFEKLGLSLYELLKKNDYRGNAIVYPLKSYLIHIRVFYRSYTVLFPADSQFYRFHACKQLNTYRFKGNKIQYILYILLISLYSQKTFFWSPMIII